MRWRQYLIQVISNERKKLIWSTSLACLKAASSHLCATGVKSWVSLGTRYFWHLHICPRHHFQVREVTELKTCNFLVDATKSISKPDQSFKLSNCLAWLKFILATEISGSSLSNGSEKSRNCSLRM